PDDSHGAPVRPTHGGRASQEPSDAAILVHLAVLGLVERRGPADVRPYLIQHPGRILGMHARDPGVDVTADLVVVTPESALQGRVDPDLVRLQIPVPDADRARTGGERVALLIFNQVLFGLPSFGDVEARPDVAGKRAVGREPRNPGDHYPPVLAVCTPEPVLHAKRSPFVERR